MPSLAKRNGEKTLVHRNDEDGCGGLDMSKLFLVHKGREQGRPLRLPWCGRLHEQSPVVGRTIYYGNARNLDGDRVVVRLYVLTQQVDRVIVHTPPLDKQFSCGATTPAGRPMPLIPQSSPFARRNA